MVFDSHYFLGTSHVLRVAYPPKAFVILSSVYGAAVNDVENYNCEIPPPDGLTYEESISLVYKVSFVKASRLISL